MDPASNTESTKTLRKQFKKTDKETKQRLKQKPDDYPLHTGILQHLHREFYRNSNPSTRDIMSIAEEINLSQERVERWFKKRRQIEKRKEEWHKKNPDSPVLEEYCSPLDEEMQWPEEAEDLSVKKADSSTRQLDMTELGHRLKELKEGRQHPEQQDVDEEEHTATEQQIEIEEANDPDFEFVKAEVEA